MLCIRSPELIDLLIENLYPLTHISPIFPLAPPHARVRVNWEKSPATHPGTYSSLSHMALSHCCP